MVIIEVKTKWHGMVAIRDKYYARAKVEGLTIKFFHQQMTLTPAQVVDEIMMGSEPIPDKFSHKTHKLLCITDGHQTNRKWSQPPGYYEQSDRQPGERNTLCQEEGLEGRGKGPDLYGPELSSYLHVATILLAHTKNHPGQPGIILYPSVIA